MAAYFPFLELNLHPDSVAAKSGVLLDDPPIILYTPTPTDPTLVSASSLGTPCPKNGLFLRRMPAMATRLHHNTIWVIHL
jgi:hypothetical protein